MPLTESMELLLKVRIDDAERLMVQFITARYLKTYQEPRP